MATLLHIPTDSLLQILKHFDARDLIRVSSTCRTLFSLTRTLPLFDLEIVPTNRHHIHAFLQTHASRLRSCVLKGCSLSTSEQWIRYITYIESFTCLHCCVPFNMLSCISHAYLKRLHIHRLKTEYPCQFHILNRFIHLKSLHLTFESDKTIHVKGLHDLYLDEFVLQCAHAFIIYTLPIVEHRVCIEAVERIDIVPMQRPSHTLLQTSVQTTMCAGGFAIDTTALKL